MVSLADLRARSITPLWQEAVAVVQELIQTVKATTGSAELLPDLEHIALIPNGDVVALPGSPEPAQPVRHAAVMLKLLLEGTPTPPELEVFVERNVADPPQYDSVAEFSRNLAFFERPGRRADVERLVGRAVAAEQTSRADEELRRLKDRASEVTVAMQAPDFLQQQEKKVKTVPIPLVAGAGVVVLAAVLFAWQWASAPQSPAPVEAAAGEPAAAATPEGGPEGVASSAPTPDPSAEAAAPGAPVAEGQAAAGGEPTAPVAEPPKSLLARAGDAVRTAVNTLIGSDPKPIAAVAPPASDEPRMAAPPRRTPRRTRTPDASPAPAAAPAPVAPTPAPEAPAAAAPTPSPMPEFIDRSAEEPVEVFTAADPSVTPAIIIRPVLPKEPPPDVPPDEVGTIEVTVDEYGDVLHVKLISPANRYRERMLVSAAKTWKFRPAYKDGRPVRYKTRVRLTI